ncbi:derlin-2.1-like [Malus sylvestris]|uniref:derlin-2.1-like n=1 Tax=Malus sylvestris TaxID=3752 RepID=UPI0021AC03F7|nr:derlin-2.1-like [Malus sylvestris]
MGSFEICSILSTSQISAVSQIRVYVCSKQNPFIHMSFLGLFYLHSSLPTWDIFSFGAIKSATDFQEYNEVAGVSTLDFGYTNNIAVTSFILYKSTLQLDL